MTVIRQIPWVDPIDAFTPVAAQSGALLLDSALVDTRVGRWTFLALSPFSRLTAKEGQVWLDDQPRKGDPFTILAEVLDRFSLRDDGPATTDTSLPPFRGGAAGLWGYDLGRTIERLPSQAADDLGLPDLVLGLYDAIAAFDRVNRRVWIISTGLPEAEGWRRERRAAARFAELEGLLARAARSAADGALDLRFSAVSAIRSNFTRGEYEAAVGRIVAYILAGDIFQANLSQRFDVELAVGQSPFDLYRRLRALSPAPFAAYLNAGELVLVSSSPERFVNLTGDAVETRPIKGTRPRGSTSAQDEMLARELISSDKDRAENVMIVDLLRNDLSKVCCDHSVRVEALCMLERYATVQHLTSCVTGRLSPGHSAVDLLRACFPGGSVTGAPKVRAMEIIDELEPTRRGPYCGAIGYIGFDGAMDTSIAIRTITCAGRRALLQAGGAVVADSDPAAEYAETLVKAQAMREALCGSV